MLRSLCSVLLASLLTVGSLPPRAAYAQAPPPPPPVEEVEKIEEVEEVEEVPIEEPADDPSFTGEPSAQPVEATSQPYTPPPSSRASRPLRIAGEVVGGVVGGLAGMTAGAATGMIGALFLSNDLWGLLFYTIIGAGIGTAVGEPIGLAIAGDLMGGDGSWLATFLGFGLGLVGAAVLSSPMIDTDDEDLIFPIYVVLPLSGGILGYELTASGDDTPVSAAMPVVGADPRSGSIFLGWYGAW